MSGGPEAEDVPLTIRRRMRRTGRGALGTLPDEAPYVSMETACWAA